MRPRACGLFERPWLRWARRNDELARILERVVEIGLRGGWAEFEGTPLQLPRIQLARPRASSSPAPERADAGDSTADTAPGDSDSSENASGGGP